MNENLCACGRIKPAECSQCFDCFVDLRANQPPPTETDKANTEWDKTP